MLRRVALALVSLVFLAPCSALGMPQRALPNFDLWTADGGRVSSVDVLGQQQWLLLYATPGCLPCDDLLVLVIRLRARGLVERTVLVMAAPREQVRAFLDQSLPAELRGLRWYTDDQASAWAALQMTGVPMLVGIRAGRIEWGISGALNDPESLGRLLSEWLASPGEAPTGGQ